MKRILLLLLLGVAALCLTATPAMADLFNFSFSGVQSNYTGNTFTVSKVSSTTDGRVFRGTDNARFQAGQWAATDDFSLWLTITGSQPLTRHGQGAFTITDIDGDTIGGTIDGD